MSDFTTKLGALLNGESESASGGFGALRQAFKQQFGHDLTITGTVTNNPYHKSKAQVDIRTRDLQPEQLRWLRLMAPQHGLRIKDFSQLTGPKTLPTGVRLSGPHMHIEPASPADISKRRAASTFTDRLSSLLSATTRRTTQAPERSIAVPFSLSQPPESIRLDITPAESGPDTLRTEPIAPVESIHRQIIPPSRVTMTESERQLLDIPETLESARPSAPAIPTPISRPEQATEIQRTAGQRQLAQSQVADEFAKGARGAVIPIQQIEQARERGLPDDVILTQIQDSIASQFGMNQEDVQTLTQTLGQHPFGNIVEPGTDTKSSVDAIIQQGKSNNGVAEFNIPADTNHRLLAALAGIHPTAMQAREAARTAQRDVTQTLPLPIPVPSTNLSEIPIPEQIRAPLAEATSGFARGGLQTVGNIISGLGQAAPVATLPVDLMGANIGDPLQKTLEQAGTNIATLQQETLAPQAGQGTLGSVAEMVGSLTPEIIGTLAVPGAPLAHRAYWFATQAAKSLGRGEAPEQALLHGLEGVAMVDLPKIMGALNEAGQSTVENIIRRTARGTLGFETGYGLAAAQGTDPRQAVEQGLLFGVMNLISRGIEPQEATNAQIRESELPINAGPPRQGEPRETNAQGQPPEVIVRQVPQRNEGAGREHGAPERQEVALGEAAWRSPEGIEFPVKITADAGIGPDGRRYVHVEGSNVVLPLDEISTTGETGRAKTIRENTRQLQEERQVPQGSKGASRTDIYQSGREQTGAVTASEGAPGRPPEAQELTSEVQRDIKRPVSEPVRREETPRVEAQRQAETQAEAPAQTPPQRQIVPKPAAPQSAPSTQITLAVEEPVAGTSPERRLDRAMRQKIEEMSPADQAEAIDILRKTVATNPKSGSPSLYAYTVAEKKPITVHSDADGLKWVNDNIGHEQGGDKLLGAVANTLREEGIEHYHISGDEFVAQFNTPAEAEAAMRRAQERLASTEITVKTPDGETKTYKGFGFSFGVGETSDVAEQALRAAKTQRAAQGLRAERGERPPSVVEVTAARQPDRVGGSPAQTEKPIETSPVLPSGKKPTVGAQVGSPAPLGGGIKEEPEFAERPTLSRAGRGTAKQTRQAWEMTRDEFVASRAYTPEQLAFEALGREGTLPGRGTPEHEAALQRAQLALLVNAAKTHRVIVNNALRDGLPVPADVRAEYPDIVKKWGWTEPPTDIVDTMLAQKPSVARGAPITTRELRQSLAKELPGRQFDEAMLQASREGKIALHHHDWPASLTEAERAGMVTDGKDFYIAASLREPTPSAPLRTLARPTLHGDEDLTTAVIKLGRLQSFGTGGQGEQARFTPKEGGRIGLISKTGRTPEDMMADLNAEGYGPFESANQLHEALREEQLGRKHYSAKRVPDEQIDAEWDAYGAQTTSDKLARDHAIMSRALAEPDLPGNKNWLAITEKIGNPAVEVTDAEIARFKRASKLIGLSEEGIDRILAQREPAQPKEPEAIPTKSAQLTTEEYDRTVEKYTALKAQNLSIDEYLRQQALFGEELSPAQQELLRELAIGKKRARPTGKQELLLETAPTVESRQAVFTAQPEARVAGPLFPASESGKIAPSLLGISPKQVDVSTPRLKLLQAQRAQTPGPINTFLQGVSNISTDLIRKYYDQFVDIRRAVKGARKRGVSITPEQDPGVINDLVFGGTGGRIEAMLLDYRDVIRDAQDTGLRDALRHWLDLKGFDRGIRILEEKEANARAAGDIRTADEYLRKLNANEVVPMGYNHNTIAMDLQAIEQQLGPARVAALKQQADRLWDLNKEAWDIAHQEGIISDAVYNQGLARGKEYIPLERIMDIADETSQHFQSALSLRQQKILKKLEGSKRITKDPFTASIERHAETIREAGRNEAARTLVNLRSVDPQGIGQFIVELQSGQKVPADMGTVAYYEAGTKKTFAVPKEWADAMNLANAHELGIVGNVLTRVTANVFRTGATVGNLAFSIPNVLRDMQDFGVLSKARPKNPMDFVKFIGQWADSLKSVLAKDADFRRYLRSRGAFSTLQRQIDPEYFLRRYISQNMRHRLNIPGRIIDSIKDFNAALEDATKFTAFKRAENMGMSDIEAPIETRRYGGSPDFARRGTDTTGLNLLMMFFNAQLQGVGRTFSRVRENPRMMIAPMVGFTTSALLLARHNHQFVSPDDGKPEWDHVTNTDKQNYFIIFHGEPYQTSSGQMRYPYWKVPKGHVAKLVFNPIQDAIDSAIGNKADLPQSALNILNNITPGSGQLKKDELVGSAARGFVSSLNPLVKEPIEQIGNIDTYRNIPIIPRGLQDVARTEQQMPTTSKTAIKIGEVTGVSPLRVEHAIRGFGAGLGEQALSAADVFQKGPGKPLEGDEKIARTPIAGPLLRRFVGSPVDQVVKDQEDKFYKAYGQAQEASKTFDSLLTNDPDRARKFAEKPDNLKAYADLARYKSVSEELSKLRKERTAIGRDEKLSHDEKKARIRKLALEERKLLSQPDEAIGVFNSEVRAMQFKALTELISRPGYKKLKSEQRAGARDQVRQMFRQFTAKEKGDIGDSRIALKSFNIKSEIQDILLDASLR